MSAGAKMFLVDQYLPLWVQCTVEGCRKWRKLPPSIELHHVKQDIVRCSDCQRKEDEVGSWRKEGLNEYNQNKIVSGSCSVPLPLSPYIGGFHGDGA